MLQILIGYARPQANQIGFASKVMITLHIETQAPKNKHHVVLKTENFSSLSLNSNTKVTKITHQTSESIYFKQLTINLSQQTS